MRNVFGFVAAAAFVVAGSAAGAAPIGDAELGFDLGGLEPSPITATGVGGNLGAPGATATLAADSLQGTVTTPITGAQPITAVQLQLSGHPTGVFAPGSGIGGGIGGFMALQGQWNNRAFAGFLLLQVPLSAIGGGGTTTVIGAAGTVFQVFGTGWTTGTATITAGSTTISGATQTPTVVQAAGGDFRTSGGGGALVLISPALVRTNLAGDLPTFAVLTLGTLPVPEPGTLLLMGAGIAGLAATGRWRSRR